MSKRDSLEQGSSDDSFDITYPRPDPTMSHIRLNKELESHRQIRRLWAHRGPRPDEKHVPTHYNCNDVACRLSYARFGNFRLILPTDTTSDLTKSPGF